MNQKCLHCPGLATETALLKLKVTGLSDTGKIDASAGVAFLSSNHTMSA